MGKQRKKEKGSVSFGGGGTTGKVTSTADGRDLRVCVCAILDSRTPLLCLPCLSTHSTYVLFSSPLLLSSYNLQSSYIVLCCVISAWVWIWVIWVFVSERVPFVLHSNAFWCIYIHKHTYTYTVPFSLCSQTLIKRVFDFSSSAAQAPHVPVGWGYKEQGGAEP